jgi:hypothetical protein
MATSITISQLPLTGTIQDTGNIVIETSGTTQRFQASSLKNYISSASLSTVTASSATFGSATITGSFSASTIVTSSNVYIGGNLIVIGAENVTGNVTLANLVASAGNITPGNLSAILTTTSQPYITTMGSITLNNLTASVNITAGNLSVTNTSTYGGTILPTSNAAAVNIGSTGAWFNNIYGTAVHALYADLAERYTSDSNYLPGTVVIFGTDTEVTASYKPNDPKVAGVVSTNPAYTMNAGIHGVDVALQGRVPCQVTGPVVRGDLMVSSPIPGVAMANNNPQIGSVLGKALGNYNGSGVGVIEVVVGRL